MRLDVEVRFVQLVAASYSLSYQPGDIAAWTKQQSTC
jgi:hypothetical protein